MSVRSFVSAIGSLGLSLPKSFPGKEAPDFPKHKTGRRAGRWFTRTKDKGSSSRQYIRRNLFIAAMEQVRKANNDMPRHERRNLARAYAVKTWLFNHKAWLAKRSET